MILGLLFGTFDPIHNGHLDIVRFGKNEAQCDEVWLIVQPVNPYKSHPPYASFKDRVAMVRIATADLDYAGVYELDPDILAAHSIADTLKELKRLDNERELVLLLGGDLVDTLPSWGDYDIILELSRIIEIKRPEHSISSGEIRRRITSGESIDGLVPKAVAEHIFEHGLYQSTMSVMPEDSRSRPHRSE